MTPYEQTAAVYAKLHKDRELHIEQARRARDMQEKLSDCVSMKSDGLVEEFIEWLIENERP